MRLKEVKAWFILRELFFLLLFLGILYAISFANRDVENAHRMVNYLRKQFLKIDYHYQYEYSLPEDKTSYVFENIQSIEDYWKWLEDVFAYRYNETVWQDNNIKSKSILQRNTRTNKIIGYPTLRQLRVKNGKYSVVLHIQNIENEIDDFISFKNEIRYVLSCRRLRGVARNLLRGGCLPAEKCFDSCE